MNPTRVVGEYSFRVVNYGGRISFRVEQELTGTGEFTCTASHRCEDVEHKLTQFTAETGEGTLKRAPAYYADFVTSPTAAALPRDVQSPINRCNTRSTSTGSALPRVSRITLPSRACRAFCTPAR